MSPEKEIKAIVADAEAKISAIAGMRVKIIVRNAFQGIRLKKAMDITFITVCYQCGFTMDELRSPSRKTTLVNARKYIAYYLTMEISGISLKKIGKELNRNHASIINLRRKAAAHLQKEPEFKEKYQQIARTIDNQLLEI